MFHKFNNIIRLRVKIKEIISHYLKVKIESRKKFKYIFFNPLIFLNFKTDNIS